MIIFRTTVAIAGEDFVVLGSDLRLSQGYNVLSRSQSKCFQLTPQTSLASTGCWTDVLALTKMLEARLTVNFNTLLYLHLI